MTLKSVLYMIITFIMMADFYCLKMSTIKSVPFQHWAVLLFEIFTVYTLFI